MRTILGHFPYVKLQDLNIFPEPEVEVVPEPEMEQEVFVVVGETKMTGQTVLEMLNNSMFFENFSVVLIFKKDE